MVYVVNPVCIGGWWSEGRPRSRNYVFHFSVQFPPRFFPEIFALNASRCRPGGASSLVVELFAIFVLTKLRFKHLPQMPISSVCSIPLFQSTDSQGSSFALAKLSSTSPIASAILAIAITATAIIRGIQIWFCGVVLPRFGFTCP